MSNPRPHPARFPSERTSRLVRTVFALTVATLASLSLAGGGNPAAEQAPAPILVSPPASVAIEEGQVTIDAHDADLADVLSELGARADFRVTTTGQLGRVTTTVTARSVEQALRQLVQDHELMLVYTGPTADSANPKLIQVDVFAASPSAASLRATRDALAQERAGALAEINQLARSRNPQQDAARLAQLVGTAPDPIVRARAAWALGRLSGPLAAAALAGALKDQVPPVRVQAVHALRSVEGARAIPALGSILLADPDVTVRLAAARMLGSLPEPEATSALSAAARDGDMQIRREVARALQRRGLVP